MIRVEHLFVSPGHNFYGRQGQPPGDHPLHEVGEVECVPGKGLRGDRFFDYKPDYKGQVTFFSAEVFDDMKRALVLPEGASPGWTRRNVIVRGLDLPALPGQEFEVQGVRFVGVEECRPCSWMNVAFVCEQAEAFLQGKGGLRARILTHGWLRTG